MKKILLIARAVSQASIEKADDFARRIQQQLVDEVQIEHCEISELFFELSRDQVAIYHPQKGFDLRDFDLVVIRHIGKMAVEAHAITQYCEFYKIKYTDQYLNRLLLDNKISTEFLLWFNGVKNHPRTFYGALPELKRRFAELGDRAILKDNQGSKGRLNFLVTSVEQIQQIHDQHPGVRFVLQEFIPNDGDLRVLILNDRPALVISRQSDGRSHLNNTSQGGKATILPLTSVAPEIVRLSIRVAQIAKLQVAGVDVMLDQRNGDIYLLEVNNAPQISSGSFTEEKAVEYAIMLKELINDN